MKRPIKAESNEEKECKDLLLAWQGAEYEAYFNQNPHNSLEEIDMKELL